MSTLLNAKRVIKAGFINFWRNGTVSLASILTYTITIFIIIGVFLGGAVLDAAVDVLKDKVDVIIYLKEDAAEEDILELKKRIEVIPEVKETTYLSREAVLDDFLEFHKEDALILQSVAELGGNPLLAELSIKAHDPSQYISIVNFLSNDSAVSKINNPNDKLIDSINFFDNESAINRLIDVTNLVDKMGIAVSILIALISILVAYNTIRLAIYTSKEEISVMRLVGAGNSYIRGPFIVEGIMYGIIAGLFALALFYPITRWVSTSTRNFLDSINIFDFYISNFPMMVLIALGTGILLGVISSALAIRRYLKI